MGSSRKAKTMITIKDINNKVLKEIDADNLQGANLIGANLERANLVGANLRESDLRGANLKESDLRRADLRKSDLRGVNLAGATLPTGEKYEKYLAEVVPALLMAGGKTLAEVVNEEVWNCHEWTICPMAVAFGVHKLSDIPLLYRPRVEQFIQLFDAGLIPMPKV